MKKNKTFIIYGKNYVATYRTYSLTGFMYLALNLILLPFTLPVFLYIVIPNKYLDIVIPGNGKKK